MPSFFQFTQGTESRVRLHDSSPLLGRFRAVVPPSPRDGAGRRPSQPNLFRAAGGGRGSVHVGYGAVLAARLDDEADDEDEDDNSNDVLGGGEDVESRWWVWWERVWRRKIMDVWVEPRQGAVRRVVEVWWTRYGALIVLPAVLVGSCLCCPRELYQRDLLWGLNAAYIYG